MKFSILIATAITTAVLAAEQVSSTYTKYEPQQCQLTKNAQKQLDVRSCVCSSAKSSCHCEDAAATVQVLPGAESNCVAPRGWQAAEEASPYADNACGHARRFADVMCSRSLPQDPWSMNACDRVNALADEQCGLVARSIDDSFSADECTAAQKRATMCLRELSPESPLPIDCSSHMRSVEEHCQISLEARGAAPDSLPPPVCGRKRCSKKRGAALDGLPPPVCGSKRCIKKRVAALDALPPPVCGSKRCSKKRATKEQLCGPALRLARDCNHRRLSVGGEPQVIVESSPATPGLLPVVCGREVQRATECVKARGWEALPWDACDSADEDCKMAAKRELGYDMEMKRDPVESAAACEISSRGGRRAVAPPHCMCSMARGDSGLDVVKRCRCAAEEEINRTQYHCMCATGEGDAMAPCSCNSDVAFLSKVQYE